MVELKLYVVSALLVPIVLLGAPIVQTVANEGQHVCLRLREQQPVIIDAVQTEEVHEMERNIKIARINHPDIEITR